MVPCTVVACLYMDCLAVACAITRPHLLITKPCYHIPQATKAIHCHKNTSRQHKKGTKPIAGLHTQKLRVSSPDTSPPIPSQQLQQTFPSMHACMHACMQPTSFVLLNCLVNLCELCIHAKYSLSSALNQVSLQCTKLAQNGGPCPPPGLAEVTCILTTEIAYCHAALRSLYRMSLPPNNQRLLPRSPSATLPNEYACAYPVKQLSE
jgi:hypothetical protein